MPKIKTASLILVCGISALLVGCLPGSPQYLAGNLNGRNHTAAAINYFTVNGYGGPNISPYGSGGGYCCVMLPKTWQPGLAVSVEWEEDPNPRASLPSVTSSEFPAAYEMHKSNYRQYAVVVEVPPYESKSLCSPTVHFLPCNQVKITTSCAYHGSPDYPIKEPRVMEEPVVCPK